MRTFSRLILVCTLILLFTGCASTQKSEFKYINATPQPVSWPALPNEPRYQYIGDLYGEINFKKSGEKSFGDRVKLFFSWLVGVFSEKYQLDFLARPQSGVVGPDGRIYVTDVSRQSVYVFDQTKGEFYRWRDVNEEQSFLTPIGITASLKGTVFVSDADLGVVVMLDQKGAFLGMIGKGILNRPTGIVWSEKEQLLFVVDTHAHDVKVFTESGELFGQFGKRGHGDGEFNSPTHIAYANGNVYVSDTLNARVQVLSRDGEYRSTIGKRGVYLGDTPRPKGVATDSSGNVYIMESFYDHLLVFNQQGDFLLPIGGAGSGPGKFFLPSGLWVDGRDRIFVADMFNGRISIFQYLKTSLVQ